MRLCCTFLTVVLAFSIAVLHNAPPYLSYQCSAFGVQCPRIKAMKSGSQRADKTLDRIIKSITHWINTGEEIASQVSIFQHDREIFNFYAADTERTGDRFDDLSLVTIWSNGKTFEALFIAMAVDQGWIDSYDDPITKYWPRFPTNRKKYNIKISDVLRHEAGLCIYQRYRIVFDLWNINIASYDLLRKAIEDEKITFYEDQSGITRTRCYHTLSRGHILNEIFHRVEPRGRYMAQFYESEILPVLIRGDPSFGMTFRGLRYVQHLQTPKSKVPSVWDEERIFSVESPSFLWNLYHVLFPKYVLKEPLESDEHLKHKMCGYLEDETLCPDQRNTNWTLFDRALDTVYEMRENRDYSPEFLGQYFRNMLIEHTSSSTLANAHSMTKAFAFMLNQLISKRTKEVMFSGVTTDFDIALDMETSFSMGGLGQFMIGGVEWFGWSGWGGSTMMYAPEYDCFLAYVVTGYARENVDHRKFVVTNLVSQFLFAT